VDGCGGAIGISWRDQGGKLGRKSFGGAARKNEPGGEKVSLKLEERKVPPL